MSGLNSLSSSDLTLVVDCIRDLYAFADLDQVPRRFLSAARRLVAGDYAAYEEMNPALGRSVGTHDPPEVRPSDDLLQVFAEYASRGEHPLIGYWMGNYLVDSSHESAIMRA